MNPAIDHYLAEGCGRCPLYATADCKVHLWQKELQYLRQLVLSCELTEELKWDVPCYTIQKKNVLILAAFKNNCTISFFKGALLKDPAKLLQKPGENTQAARLIRFTSLKEIIKHEDAIRALIFAAIDVELAGKKIKPKKPEDLAMPDEFKQQLITVPGLKEAFKALTPGRQKAYLLYFSDAKQSATRLARIEKYMPKILQGRGFLD